MCYGGKRNGGRGKGKKREAEKERGREIGRDGVEAVVTSSEEGQEEREYTGEDGGNLLTLAGRRLGMGGVCLLKGQGT